MNLSTSNHALLMAKEYDLIPSHLISQCRIGNFILLTRYEGFYQATLEDESGKIIESLSDSFPNCWKQIQLWSTWIKKAGV